MSILESTQHVFSTQYFGGIEFYLMLIQNNELFIERNENYQKRSLRNKVYISGPQGEEVISVPLVKGKNASTPITEVKISYDEDWTRQHIQTIQSSYGNSPFLEYYLEDIVIILNKRHEKLWDLNNALFNYIIQKLDIEQNLRFTETYEKTYSFDFRNSNSSSYGHMRSEIFKNLRYNQVFELKHGFLPNLSILDLLFCCGPESILKLNAIVLS